MGIVFLRKVLSAIEEYKELNENEQAEFRKIMELRAWDEDFPGVRP